MNFPISKVGWVKADTKAIQAIHDHLITHNPRVSVSHLDVNTWNLHIKSVAEEDRGGYMCQINTDPMKSCVSCWFPKVLFFWQVGDKKIFGRNKFKRLKLSPLLLFTVHVQFERRKFLVMKSGIINDKLGNMTKIEFIFVFRKNPLWEFMILAQDTFCLSTWTWRKEKRKIENFDNVVKKDLLRFVVCGKVMKCLNVFVEWTFVPDWISWRCDSSRLYSWRHIIRCHRARRQFSQTDLQVRHFYLSVTC